METDYLFSRHTKSDWNLMTAVGKIYTIIRNIFYTLLNTLVNSLVTGIANLKFKSSQLVMGKCFYRREFLIDSELPPLPLLQVSSVITWDAVNRVIKLDNKCRQKYLRILFTSTGLKGRQEILLFIRVKTIK